MVMNLLGRPLVSFDVELEPKLVIDSAGTAWFPGGLSL
jgi:hypothetical protein